MLLDNENSTNKVHEWIARYTEEGKLDVVTGYFTIGALAYLSKTTNNKIDQYRFILGDIVNIDEVKDRALDLLNEDITIEAALKLSSISREAVEFLKQDKVLAKTLEPNFCHAKAYIQTVKKDDRLNYYITGSSNLTEAGIGLKTTSNVELNLSETGLSLQYKELRAWFESLWSKPQAHLNKSIKDDKGKIHKIPFKEYLIAEIEKVFIQYTPRELYYKVLFELFGEQLLIDLEDPEFNRQIGRLENSVVYQSLYNFQQKGVLSLIKMLQKYNGAILADAVGLGKTWSALAVMKFFQLQGREIIVLCPKKLHYNWLRFRKNQNSKFDKDQLDFCIRYHTDLNAELMDKDAYKVERADTFFKNDRPKLFVIDESHNLRNDKSNRYKFLIEQILSKNEDAKVLMLSATPINNSLNDIRNQFKLVVKGDSGGFNSTLGIRNLDYAFRTAQKAFNEWRIKDRPKISEFIKEIPDNFFKLTDALIVARTRSMINGHDTELIFPKKEKPDNLFVTPKEIGNFESFEELFKKFPPMLSGYQPTFYTEPMAEKKKRQEAKKKGEFTVSVIDDEIQRDKFLVKMMYILMVKRLESSWFSFYSTVFKIKDHHENALKRIKEYEEKKVDSIIDEDSTNMLDDEETEDIKIDLTLGKKRKVLLSDIDKAGNLTHYKKDLKKDIDALDNICSNLLRFKSKIETENKIPANHKSDDSKLDVLIAKILKKRASGENNNNLKVVIFTVYRDTAEYLFNQLKTRGFDKIGMVSGTGSRTSDSTEEHKNFEPILERFAPYTKLYREKEWEFKPSSSNLGNLEKYREWIQWVSENDPQVYSLVQNPIDILIATDALSEGQNLQDADMVINYDIHWNPVRIIQRMGRIDRLGSPNNKIFGVNFWPSNNINSYLNLQGRIEQRMATMQLAGAEVHLEFSETFKEMAEDENLENRMKARMMEQMQVSWDDIEINEQGLGFNNLSLEKYRQDLLEEYKSNTAKYSSMPKGVYTGFKIASDCCPKEGIIALLGYPSKPPKVEQHTYQEYDLIYIDDKGEQVLLNHKEVLDVLTIHKDERRYVPDSIDKGEEESILKLTLALKKWMEKQSADVKTLEDGTIKKAIGREVKDILSKLKKGDKDAISRISENLTAQEKYQFNKFDLITWFIVTE